MACEGVRESHPVVRLCETLRVSVCESAGVCESAIVCKKSVRLCETL
jgi:hypothetical protein